VWAADEDAEEESEEKEEEEGEEKEDAADAEFGLTRLTQTLRVKG